MPEKKKTEQSPDSFKPNPFANYASDSIYDPPDAGFEPLTDDENEDEIWNFKVNGVRVKSVDENNDFETHTTRYFLFMLLVFSL